MKRRHSFNRIDFRQINASALNCTTHVLSWLLPGGKLEGNEWVALNPHRSDRRLGSFKINVRTGRWCDFAIGQAGGDLVSLVAYLHNIRQIEAARKLADYLGERV